MARKPVGRFVYDGASPEEVAEGGNVAYSAATVDGGCMLHAGNGSVRMQRAGLYRVSFSATLEATAAGSVWLRLRHGGEDVPGACGAATLAAVGDLANVSFSSPVTVECCAGDSVSVRASAATSVAAACLVVEKVA